MVIRHEQMADLMIWMIGLPLGGAIINGVLGARLSKALVAWVACMAMAASFAIAVCLTLALAQQEPATAFVTSPWTWITSTFVTVDLTLHLDALSSMMTLIICGVGTLIHVFSWGYMGDHPSVGRYFSYLNLFCAAMLLLVMGDALPSLFIGWEGVGLCSYLLIGFSFEDAEKARAGRKAFVVNRIGDAGLLVAMYLLHATIGSLSLPAINAAALSGGVSSGVAFWACLALALGVAGKSAQLPLYIWLPDAMAGPTPVSALIHAATMVTAGIYLMVRLTPLFALAPSVQDAIAIMGACTALFAATAAIVQTDIKKVLAYSTVSQLGYMVMACGMGAPVLAMFHVTTHAFFKACLFLGAGAVIHALADEQDLRRMGGLAKRMPLTCATFTAATLALAGVPPLAGFISKDAILGHAFALSYGAGRGGLGYVLFAAGLITAALTAFYMGRVVCLTFFSGPYRGPASVGHHAHDAPTSMALPLVILALLACTGGLLGWPHVLGGHMPLAAWLTPAIGPSPHIDTPLPAQIEGMLMGVGALAACIGLALAAARYGKAMPAAQAGHPHPWAMAMRQAWGVDAGLRAAVAKPYSQGAYGLREGVERPLIEGSLQGIGWCIRTVGATLQMLHSGNMQRYLAIFVMGAALLLYGWLLPAAAHEPAPAPMAAACGYDGARL